MGAYSEGGSSCYLLIPRDSKDWLWWLPKQVDPHAELLTLTHYGIFLVLKSSCMPARFFSKGGDWIKGRRLKLLWRDPCAMIVILRLTQMLLSWLLTAWVCPILLYWYQRFLIVWMGKWLVTAHCMWPSCVWNPVFSCTCICQGVTLTFMPLYLPYMFVYQVCDAYLHGSWYFICFIFCYCFLCLCMS